MVFGLDFTVLRIGFEGFSQDEDLGWFFQVWIGFQDQDLIGFFRFGFFVILDFCDTGFWSVFFRIWIVFGC